MQTGPLIAAALMLTLVLPVASADGLPDPALGEQIEGLVGALPTPDPSADDPLAPVEELPEWIPTVPSLEEGEDEIVTPEEWAEFLAAVDAAVEQAYPGVPRVGVYAPEVTDGLIEDTVQLLDRSLVDQVIALLPATECQNEDPVKCIIDFVYEAIGNIRFAADGLQPPVGVTTTPSPAKFAFGFKVAAIGPSSAGGMPVAPGHLYVSING